MRITTIPCGVLAANCYIVESDTNAVIIDPGFFENEIFDYIEENPQKIKYILLTHGHFDHIFAAEKVQKMTDAKIVIGKGDEKALVNDAFNLSYGFRLPYGEIGTNPKGEITVLDGEVINLDDMSFKVISTPGHSPGGVCYLCEDILFSGDTLFAGSIGRTDFPNSNLSELFVSLNKLKSLNDDINVYPGHGEPTTIGEEKHNNFYMKFQGGF